MTVWGINALNHDASLAVVSDKLEYWKLSSEITGVKRDDKISKQQIQEALAFGKPKRIYWYERPWIKKSRQLYAGQYDTVFNLQNLPSTHLKELSLDIPVTYIPHHASHAAAGYYTCPFDDAVIVVLDAIGEWECATIWHGNNGKLKKINSWSYPNSMGLFYSAFTKLIGFTPIEQEFLLQQASENGDPHRYYHTVKEYFTGKLNLRYNLHRGVYNWPHEIHNLQDQCDIAAAVQQVFEEHLIAIMREARIATYRYSNKRNLIYMGGCAMNSKANKLIVTHWDKVWSLSNPGDPSSSIGAALYGTKQHIYWNGPQAKHIEIKL
jgi:carbamoyltransferase